jgi:hypothetical protein
MHDYNNHYQMFGLMFLAARQRMSFLNFLTTLTLEIGSELNTKVEAYEILHMLTKI